MVLAAEQIHQNKLIGGQRYENYRRRLTSIQEILTECDAIRFLLKTIVDSYKGYFNTAVEHIEKAAVEGGDFLQQKQRFQEFLDSLVDLNNDELFNQFQNIQEGYTQASDVSAGVYEYLDEFEDSCVIQRDNIFKLKEKVGGSVGLLKKFQGEFDKILQVRSVVRNQLTSTDVDIIQNSEIDELRGQVEFLTSMVLELKKNISKKEDNNVGAIEYLCAEDFQDFEDEQKESLRVSDSLLLSLVSSLYPNGVDVSHENVSLSSHSSLFESNESLIQILPKEMLAERSMQYLQQSGDNYYYEECNNTLYIPLSFKGCVLSVLEISNVGVPRGEFKNDELFTLQESLLSRFDRESKVGIVDKLESAQGNFIFRESKENFEKLLHDKNYVSYLVSNDGEGLKERLLKTILTYPELVVGHDVYFTSGTFKFCTERLAEMNLNNDAVSRAYQEFYWAAVLSEVLSDPEYKKINTLITTIEKNNGMISRVTDYSQFKSSVSQVRKLNTDPKKIQSKEGILHDSFVLAKGLEAFGIDFKELKKEVLDTNDKTDIVQSFFEQFEKEVNHWLEVPSNNTEEWGKFAYAFDRSQDQGFMPFLNQIDRIPGRNLYEFVKNSAYFFVGGEEKTSEIFRKSFENCIHNAACKVKVPQTDASKIIALLKDKVSKVTFENSHKTLFTRIKTFKDFEKYCLGHGPNLGDPALLEKIKELDEKGRNQLLLFFMDPKSPHYNVKIADALAKISKKVTWGQNEFSTSLIASALKNETEPNMNNVIHYAQDCILYFESHEEYNIFLEQNSDQMCEVVARKTGFPSIERMQVFIKDVGPMVEHLNQKRVKDPNSSVLVINPAEHNLFAKKELSDEVAKLYNMGGEKANIAIGGWALWAGLVQYKKALVAKQH